MIKHPHFLKNLEDTLNKAPYHAVKMVATFL